MEILILYPDRRWVDESTIKMWASDDLANNVGITRASDDIKLSEAIEILGTYGDVTVSNRRRIQYDYPGGYSESVEWKV